MSDVFEMECCTDAPLFTALMIAEYVISLAITKRGKSIARKPNAARIDSAAESGGTSMSYQLLPISACEPARTPAHGNALLVWVNRAVSVTDRAGY
jgi:hypothetical protein